MRPEIILDVMDREGDITAAALVDAHGISARQARRVLRDLEALDLVSLCRHSSGQGVAYRAMWTRRRREG
jgi:predicted ArsR family transcriptional regulator